LGKARAGIEAKDVPANSRRGIVQLNPEGLSEAKCLRRKKERRHSLELVVISIINIKKYQMKQTILVTGASGHLGLNTVRSLLEKGYHVKAFVRKTSNLSGLEGLPVEYCQGDVRDLNALTDASANCDVIIHHAAVYKIWAKTVEEIMEPAMEGTKNIFAAASATGVKKIIYTSSIVAIGTTADPKISLNENDWNKNDTLAYSVAKTRSEQLAWELSDKYSIPMISLCPGQIFGRYDYRITPSNRLVLDMMKGIGTTMNTVLSCVDARDVGEVHALAVEEGKIGSRYVLTGNSVDMKSMGKMVSDMTGKIVPHLPFGRSIIITTASIMELAAKLTGWDPPLSVGLAKEYCHRYARYDNSKTVQDFNYTFLSTEETMRDTIKWLTFVKGIKLNKKIEKEFLPETDWIQ